MSLLEDIFLADEANEAQELERVIDGDEFDEQARAVSDSDSDTNGNREDEAEEDKRRVDPTSTKTKRVTKNPRFILNPARLTGPRGIQVIPELFKDFKFKGKGHEKEDLDMVLKKLEYWAYRLYPRFEFKDCLKKIETLGKKRPVMVHLHKIRTDQFMSEETVVQKDSSDDDEAQPPQEEDEFDKLLQQQIDLARATPAPGSVKKGDRSDQWAKVIETPNRGDRSILPMPKATSSPSISDEQKERMIRNRKLAEERRLARLKQSTIIDNTPATIMEIDENEIVTSTNDEIKINDNMTVISRKNKSNVIDSSDSEEECNVMAFNESIVVDVHSVGNNMEKCDDKFDKMVHNLNAVKNTPVDVDKENRIAEDKEGKENIDDQNTIHDVQIEEPNNVIDNSEKNNDTSDKIVTVNRVCDTMTSEDKTKTYNQSSDLSTNNDYEITKQASQGSAKPIENTDEFLENIMDVDFSDDF